MDEEELNGVVSLGMEARSGVDCPNCHNDVALLTHNGEGDEVLCCINCQKFWKVSDSAETQNT